jgi:hypothetical protein
MTILLIGGGSDGKWVDVEDHSEVIYSVCMDATDPCVFHPEELNKAVPVEIYRVQRIRCENALLKVAVVDGMSMLGAMNKLINNYKGDK